MLCQNETGVLSGSELYFNTAGATTQRLFYYINSCGHYYCQQGYKVRRQYMNNVLLMLLEQGTMRVEYRGEKYTAQAGDIILMDCTYPQYYDTPDYVEFYWLHIAGVNSFELCDYLYRAYGSIVYHTQDREKAAAHIRYLVSQFATNQPIMDAEHSRLLHSVLCYLMPATRAANTMSSDDPVQQAMKYISTHLSSDLSLQRIAREVHLSPSHLVRLFRMRLNHSPHEYIMLMRMDRAKYLLKTTDLPVKAVAAEVGYKTESSFTGAFTDKIGIPPRRFRNLPLG